MLIGNAAAALHGAPVTTVDFDFYFRKTPLNLAKLRKFAKLLDAIIMRPYYPVSSLLRVSNDEHGLQIDFMSQIHGINSFASLRSRSEEMKLGNTSVLVASLSDIIKSKSVAGRAKDRSVIEILKLTLHEKEKLQQKKGSQAPTEEKITQRTKKRK